MIDIGKLTLADVGRAVVYSPRGGGRREDGEISSWNERYVFVRYRGGFTASTSPEDLDFLSAMVRP